MGSGLPLSSQLTEAGRFPASRGKWEHMGLYTVSVLLDLGWGTDNLAVKAGEIFLRLFFGFGGRPSRKAKQVDCDG